MSPADQPIAIGLAVVSALAFVVWITDASRRARRDRQREAALDVWPEDDYLGEWECRVADCDRSASVWVDQPYAGRMFVCRTCAADGAALGWWTAAT